MTDDRRVRLREGCRAEPLPTARTFRLTPRDPGEGARPGTENLEHDRRVGRLLKEKGFGVAGDEPVGARVNRHLRLGGDRDT